MNLTSSLSDFVRARYGLFVHYGLYSLLGRGEWVMNREQIAVSDYRKLADRFTAARFDAGALCDLAVRAGMRYVVFTTMHHEGFCLYDTNLTDFSSVRSPARRDLVAEMIRAARERGLKIGLYHSLNNWSAMPDAATALENPDAKEEFLQKTHARVRELVTRYQPVDVLWYDGWWPFDAGGWRAREMNAMVLGIQPHILFNGRNGLAGDFATPEGHLSTPKPWRPWEACVPLNNSWGFHGGDHDWKAPGQIVDMLAKAASEKGNLLLNIGPQGDGSVPRAACQILETVGHWLQKNGEAIFDTDFFSYDLRERGSLPGDWCHHGSFTARGRSLYLIIRRWTGDSLTLNGLECRVEKATLLGTKISPAFSQSGSRLHLQGLPIQTPDPVGSVLRLDCDRPPSMYLCGGMRIPVVEHPHYDPCPSDIIH